MMASTRTGLFPSAVVVQPASKNVKDKNKTKSERTPRVSILKRKTDAVPISSSVKAKTPARITEPSAAGASTSRHVNFKSVSTEQESLREKLNQWLAAKGKTPSRCRYLMSFNVQVAAKKKQTQPERLVDRTITQNLLSGQLATLEKEEVLPEPKKCFFEEVQRPEVKRCGGNSVSVEKENRRSRRSIRFQDELDERDSRKLTDNTGELLISDKSYDPPSLHSSPAEKLTTSSDNEEVLTYLTSMLEECNILHDAGCPLDKLLPWLADIETHVPQAKMFALFYVTKAKVLSAFPQRVLDVYCQAVRNNAKPSDLLAAEMKSSLSLLMAQPPFVSLPKSVSVASPLPSPGMPHSYGNSSSYTYAGNSATSMSKSQDSSVGDLTISASYLTNLGETNGTGSGPMHTQKQAVTTPARSTALGSKLYFAVKSATPLLRFCGQQKSPVAVVTPVRRSARLSGRQLTPRNALTRAVSSMSDLTESERQSLLYQTNPSLTGKS